MLRKRIFRDIWQANTANRRSIPHVDAIKRTLARTAWRQKGSEDSAHCATYDLNRSFWQMKDTKRTIYEMQRTRNGTTITWIERPLWQDIEFKTQCQQLGKSRKIWEMLKRLDQHPKSPNKHFSGCWTLSESVGVILHVPTLRRTGKTKMIMKIQSWASSAKLTNPAGWWAQSPTQCSTTRRAFWQQLMRLEELMQPGWGDVVDNFSQSDMNYRMAELMVAAVVKPQTQSTAATPSPTTFEELMQTLDTIPGLLQMPHGTSRQGSGQMRLGSN